jgi:hypothetical protein
MMSSGHDGVGALEPVFSDGAGRLCMDSEGLEEEEEENDSGDRAAEEEASRRAVGARLLDESCGYHGPFPHKRNAPPTPARA